jgi:single-strand DNA-binding protein
MNRSVLVGRMTRDPELRRTQSGNAVTSFTLALNRNYNSANGQTADFIPVVCWNKAAENVAKYCSKGSLVGVDGRLQSRSYDNAQGNKVYVVEVVADSVQFLESKSQREQNQPQTSQPNMNTSNNDIETVKLEDDFDNSDNSLDIMEDDIQF